VIKPSFEFVDEIDGVKILKKIERMSRICYKSEAQITDTSYIQMVKHILERGHESQLEHASVTVIVTCDRGVTHEIVRHRLASYSQESTRYCNYSKDKFGNELTFIKPCFWDEDTAIKSVLEETSLYKDWFGAMQFAEKRYLDMIAKGAKPEQARSILPNSLKTEIGITMNLREWRHFFKLRTAKAAHPQMREIACQMLKEFSNRIPMVFDNIQGDSDA